MLNCFPHIIIFSNTLEETNNVVLYMFSVFTPKGAYQKSIMVNDNSIAFTFDVHNVHTFNSTVKPFLERLILQLCTFFGKKIFSF